MRVGPVERTGRSRATMVVSAAALIIGLAHLQVAEAKLRKVAPGQPVPPFRLSRADGPAVERDAPAAGTLLAYVDPSRESCRDVVLALQSIQRQYATRGLRVILAADPTRSRDAYLAWAEKEKIDLPLLDDLGSKLYGDLGVFVIPTTIFFDKQGILLQDIPSYGADFPARADAYAQRLLGLIDGREMEALLDVRSHLTPDSASKAERHRRAARLLAEKGEIDQAIEELERASELDPSSWLIRADLGDLLLSKGRHPDALAIFSALDAKEISSARIKEGLGRAEAGLGRNREAIEHLQAALLLNPNPARIHFEMGRVCERLGDKDRALEHYRKALERIFR